MHKKQKIKIGEWEVFDLPIKYDEADYDEARAEIVDKIKKVPGLIALFEYGCLSVLGINDIDLWAIFADDAPKMYIPNEPILSEKTRYLMKQYRIPVMSEKHYRKMLYFDPWTTYVWPNGQRLLYQKKDIKRDLNFEKIQFNKEEKDTLSAAFIERMLGGIYAGIPFFAKKQLPIRDIFERIKDCVYIIEEVNNITGKNISHGFSKEFKDLRSNWFEIDIRKGAKQLIGLFYQGLLIGFEAAFALAGWLDKNSQQVSFKDLQLKKTNFRRHSILDKKYKNIYLSTFQDRRIFTDFIKSPKMALESTIKSYQEIKMNLGWRIKVIDFYIIFQPLEMANILLGFADGKGLLSNNLRKDIFTNREKVSVFRPKIFQDKIKIINEITELYNKKQVIDSNGKGFLFGNHRFGYLFEHESLKRKLLTSWLKYKFWQTSNKLT